MLAARSIITMESWFVQARRVLGRADTTLDSILARPAAGDADTGLTASLELVIKLGRALLAYGLPAPRLLESLERLSAALGFAAIYYVTPTGIIFTFGAGGDTRTRVVAAAPGDVDLERLTALHDLIGRVERKEISPSDASSRVDEILARPPRYRGISRVLGFGGLSLVAAQLLGGAPMDLAAAGGMGIGVGLLSMLGSRVATIGRLLPALAAFLASLTAITLARAGAPVEPSVLLLASVMSTLPGLTMTIGITELATAHLVSGTARLAGAIVTFLQLGFGTAAGHKLAHSLFVAVEPTTSNALPTWTQALAPLGAALAFGVLLRVRPRDLGGVLVACAVAIAGSRVGGAVFGAEVGAFLGAFVLGVVAHLYARWKDRPALVLLVPGILMMVPGSLGFLGLSALLAENPTGAVQTAFQVLMIATALAAGVLLATLAVPPRRAL